MALARARATGSGTAAPARDRGHPHSQKLTRRSAGVRCCLLSPAAGRRAPPSRTARCAAEQRKMETRKSGEKFSSRTRRAEFASGGMRVAGPLLLRCGRVAVCHIRICTVLHGPLLNRTSNRCTLHRYRGSAEGMAGVVVATSGALRCCLLVGRGGRHRRWQ